MTRTSLPSCQACLISPVVQSGAQTEEPMFPTRLLNLERSAYGEVLSLMRRLVEVKRRASGPEVLMLLEHEPVLTMGRRAEVSDILVSEETLLKKGIAIYRVERGGLITYHGPGQLIGYPIFNIRGMGLGAPELVHRLEEVIINTLSVFGIAADRKEGERGVWVKADKIASVGVAIRGGISFHGVALNYDPDLSHFELINPCGLKGVHVTSMSRILREPIDSSSLRDAMIFHFKQQFQLDLNEWSIFQAVKYSF